MHKSSYHLFAISSSPASFHLRPLMSKLQNPVFESCTRFHLPCSVPHKNGQRYLLEFRGPRLLSTMSIGQSRISHGFGGGCKSSTSLYSGLRPGIVNCTSFDGAVMMSLRNPFGDLSERCFCQGSRLWNKNEKKGGYFKNWRQAEAASAAIKRRKADSSVTVSEEVDALTSSDKAVENGKLASSASSSTTVSDQSQNTEVSGKQKKKSRSKKSKVQAASSSTTSEEVGVPKSPKKTSRSKKSVTSKSGQSDKQGSEKKSISSATEEVPGGSDLTEHQSDKNGGNSGKKGKSTKKASRSSETQSPQDMSKLKNLRQGNLKPLYPPTGKSVVVVESVTKAKVIQGYLGDKYEVVPSYGHVRDLAARSGSVRPDEDFSMVWEVPSAAWTHLKSIKVALGGAENLILASDPDREGEAIAWHIFEMLQQQDALHQGTTVARVVFHEITEASIKNALKAPREIEANLVQAYLARRALDYLIGFNISPLLWRKLPGCQSAGRVQSAALALICDREIEIDEFKPQEYWTIHVQLNKTDVGSLVNAHLTSFDSKKLNQLQIGSHAEAKDMEEKIKSEKFQVINTKRGQIRRNPPTPYITSTLQQDAANKLYFSSTYTMKVAQKLYEGVQLANGKAMGLITYTRTDGLHISDEAVKSIHLLVTERYGPDFAPATGRKYFKKVKNAQEAHEAIRPTDIKILPSMLVDVLDEDSLKLYALIWTRTVACQMEPALIDQIQVDIGNASKSIMFRSSSSEVGFRGYQAVYEDVEVGAVQLKENEALDRAEAFGILSSSKSGDPMCLGEIDLKQHFTQPPPRYSEGSIVKKLEELGIGRPSTYASTLKVLQDRNYVTTKSRVLYPEFRGRMVSAFLSHHFTEVTDYSFTADMENELDNVSAGLTEWKGLLKDYWTRFSSYCKRTASVHIHQVEKMLERKFENFLFSSLPDNNRTCPSCMEGTLIFKVSRFGAGYFIGCDQHPNCKYIAKTLYGDDDEDETPQNSASVEEPRLLGCHPVSNEKILLKNGPYGFYVQLGEDRRNYIPKRASVSNIKDVDSITLEDALKLLRYPVTLGNHPKDGNPVMLKLAKDGYAVKHRSSSVAVPKNVNPDDVTLEKALKLLQSKFVKRSGRPKAKPKVEEAIEAI